MITNAHPMNIKAAVVTSEVEANKNEMQENEFGSDEESKPRPGEANLFVGF